MSNESLIFNLITMHFEKITIVDFRKKNYASQPAVRLINNNCEDIKVYTFEIITNVLNSIILY